jgi:hypothetical protein
VIKKVQATALSLQTGERLNLVIQNAAFQIARSAHGSKISTQYGVTRVHSIWLRAWQVPGLIPIISGEVTNLPGYGIDISLQQRPRERQEVHDLRYQNDWGRICLKSLTMQNEEREINRVADDLHA